MSNDKYTLGMIGLGTMGRNLLLNMADHGFAVAGYDKDPSKLTLLENEVLALSKLYGWQLEAWAVFMNHYHLIARGEPSSKRLDRYLKHIHGNTARELNILDQTVGRKVWYNFWETRLTYERSYLARLNYVHQNAVKHGLVRVANQYEWCSAAWFERTASPPAVKTPPLRPRRPWPPSGSRWKWCRSRGVI